MSELPGTVLHQVTLPSGEVTFTHVVADGLAVGPAIHIPHLRGKGWTAMLIARECTEEADCKVGLKDKDGNAETKIRTILDTLARWRRDGKKVLVSCGAGRSRAASIAAAHLVDTGRAASFEEALATIKGHRPEVNPNDGIRANVLRAMKWGEEDMRPAVKRKVLIKFWHGLGDAVQVGIVLRHLKKYRPNWELFLIAKRGKESAAKGFCERVWHDQEPQPDDATFDRIYTLDWEENYCRYPDRPNTKVTKCLDEVFNISFDPSLGRYELNTPPECYTRADDYLRSIGCTKREDGRWGAVILHGEGNTSPEKKNLSHREMLLLCKVARECGCVPVILDFDGRSPLPDGREIFCPGVGPGDLWGGFGSGDALAIAGLMARAAAVVGVDSGPGHVAGAVDTPTLLIWKKHHPIQFYDLCPNVLHLLPVDHPQYAPAGINLDYFHKNYRYEVMGRCMATAAKCLEEAITGKPAEKYMGESMPELLQSTAFAADYYEEHKMSGLDYLGFGDWQRQYGRWFVESLGLYHKAVLDVGCACGSIVRGLGEAGAFVQGVDCGEFLIQKGRQKWPDMTPIIHTCDALNLHLYKDASWDCIHSAQVAEHWKPHQVAMVLAELNRVTRPGGLFFCCLDTKELFARQNRTMETEDKTHYCIKPMAWWYERLQAAGWEVCTDQFRLALSTHELSFLARYDWDWFVARKVREAENGG